MNMKIPSRTLFFGDNLEILRNKIPDESFDLIYLDPPFNSKRSYNILFKEGLQESQGQVRAFEDTWHWTRETQEIFDWLVTNTDEDISNLMLAMRRLLGKKGNDVLAYLTMMTVRLIELDRVLKPTGSLYLHCDPTASHYLKITLDTIFGKKNFRNEIIWHYRRWTGKSKMFQKLHDVIFFYTKSGNYTFNEIFTEYTEGSKDRKLGGILHRFKKGEAYLVSEKSVDKQGVRENDVWQIPFVAPSAKERLGYPTQKPEALLEKIIKASSNEGDWVLDPFCGCGTTVAVGERLKRNWVGVDITILAINLIKARLEKQFPSKKLELNIDGIPYDLPSAKAFFEKDPYQFQIWAVGLVSGMSKDNGVKGADKGVDGVIVIKDINSEGKAFYRKGIVQVKGGKVQRNQVATLKADVERERADFGIFVTLEEPTKPMLEEAVVAGEFRVLNKTSYPKIQVITIRELLEGKKPNLPSGMIEPPLPQATEKIDAEKLSLFAS